MIAPGTYAFGPRDGALKVRTERAGAAARAGHDLLLEARDWHAVLVVDPDGTKTTLSATVDPGSLDVVTGSGGLKPLTSADRADIAANIARKVLAIDRHREIRFESLRARAGDDGTLTVAGELELAGSTQPVELRIERYEEDGGAVLAANVKLKQTRFGIKPFSAMMGALKVADRVSVEIWARV